MTSTHPFRFGTQQRHAPDAAAWRSLACRAEDLGYSSLFLPDHFHDAWSPLVPLTVAVEATTTLKVGTLVIDNDFRHPLVLAREIAALDLLSEGRVELGIGAGWMTADYEQAGLTMAPPGVRIARLGEAVEILHGLWSEDSFSFTGSHYQLREAVCTPRPHTPGGPPLIIGGGGRRVLTLAAQHADIIGVAARLSSGVVGAETAATAVRHHYLERLEWIRDAAGPRFADLELQVLVNLVYVGPDRESFAESIAPLVGLSPEDILDAPVTLAGTVDEICDQLEERRKMYGLSYIVIQDSDQSAMQAFAPVVERLSGR
ncbi:TIGR03621 family F420-dependent LLM class oxidoreductase [Nocardia vinacea]|uniref:TIGR03621 family F420-dependent LLM class oxidoreductase n=1 Tax=Nocardia vinacea TaxID=96468 RepID=UPI0034429BA7